LTIDRVLDNEFILSSLSTSNVFMRSPPVSDNKMAQILLSLSLSLSLSLILSTLRRNAYRISESAPVRIKMPGLFYVNIQELRKDD